MSKNCSKIAVSIVLPWHCSICQQATAWYTVNKLLLGILSTSYWYTVNKLLVYCQQATGILSTSYWYTVNKLLVYCQQATGILSTSYWYTVNKLLVYCQQATGILSTSYWYTVNSVHDLTLHAMTMLNVRLTLLPASCSTFALI